MKAVHLISLIFLTYISYAQEWSPLGAEWYYDVTHNFSGNIDYLKVYCDSSVNIKGIDCKRINIDYCACNNHFCQKLYTYDRNDTVFFYNPDIDTFQILYNFTALQGDSWIIITKDYDESYDTIVVQVDSVKSTVINGKILKKLYVTYNYLNFHDPLPDTLKEGSKIIETLGDLEFLINIFDRFYAMCDGAYIHLLRCYEDTILGFYSTGLRDSCTYEYVWTSIDNKQFSEPLKIYPNPTTGIITITSNKVDNIHYEIYDARGLLFEKGIETEIDLSDFKPGIYHLRITLDNKYYRTIKIIKHLP